MTTNTQPQTQQSGGDELDIQTRIKMLEIIKPLTDHLRDITSNHDTNGMNSLIISALLPFVHERERAARVNELIGVVQDPEYRNAKQLKNRHAPLSTRAIKRRLEELRFQVQPKPQAGEGGEG
jgi:hypothetical protein